MSLWSWCCWWSWCVFSACACVFVCLCELRHAEKMWKNPVCGFKTAPCVHSKRPVCTGTARTCVSTCARGAGTHGEVLNPHTGGRGSSSVCLPKFAHVGLSRDSEVHQRNPWILPIFSLRIGREQHVADTSNHPLCLIKLFGSSPPSSPSSATQR